MTSGTPAPHYGWSVGIDIGGTFTDVIAVGPHGSVVLKVASTPGNPSDAVAAALSALSVGHGISLRDEAPIRVNRWTLRAGSGGDGTWRGGLGQVKEFEVLDDIEGSLSFFAPRGAPLRTGRGSRRRSGGFGCEVMDHTTGWFQRDDPIENRDAAFAGRQTGDRDCGRRRLRTAGCTQRGRPLCRQGKRQAWAQHRLTRDGSIIGDSKRC